MNILQVSEILVEHDNDTFQSAMLKSSLTLPFESRQKSRLRTRLDNDVEVGLLLPRGTVLRQGDLLRADNGMVIEIRAANELVSTAYSKDAYTLARACYHLGNRHVALQIGASTGSNWVRYLHDHVLDEMVVKLGLELKIEQAPFEPEAGAYHGLGHSHGHTH